MVSSKEHRAAALKERVYVTFAALAVTLAVRAHGDSASDALRTLVISVAGTVLAVFLADVVAHIVVAEAFPSRVEAAAMARVSLGASTVLGIPIIALLLATADVLSVETALDTSSGMLVLSLVAIGFLAVRRLRLSGFQRLVVLFSEFLIGALVVALQVLAKG